MGSREDFLPAIISWAINVPDFMRLVYLPLVSYSFSGCRRTGSPCIHWHGCLESPARNLTSPSLSNKFLSEKLEKSWRTSRFMIGPCRKIASNLMISPNSHYISRHTREESCCALVVQHALSNSCSWTLVSFERFSCSSFGDCPEGIDHDLHECRSGCFRAIHVLCRRWALSCIKDNRMDLWP